jgi:hypothetical protein
VTQSTFFALMLLSIFFYTSDRHQLVQQMQQIGNGALGPQAANTIRVVAAQNGVWSLGNFGGLPPSSLSNGATVSLVRFRLSHGIHHAPISLTIPCISFRRLRQTRKPICLLDHHTRIKNSWQWWKKMNIDIYSSLVLLPW